MGFWGDALNFAGGLFTQGDWLNYRGAQETNAANIQQAREQMAFQERMSNSAYQRGMDDMKKAGLNPMLAFSQGGASTPTGTMAKLENPRMGDAIKGAMGTAEKINQYQQQRATIENTKKDNELKDSQKGLVDQDWLKRGREAENLKIEKDILTARKEQEQNAAKSSAAIAKAEKAKAEKEAQRDKIEKNPWVMGTDMLLKRAGELMNVVKPFKAGGYSSESTTYYGSGPRSGEIIRETTRKGKR